MFDSGASCSAGQHVSAVLHYRSYFCSCLPDDGKIFHGSGVGDAFGPRCFKGDIMGCGIMFPLDYILDGEGNDTQSIKWLTCL